MFEPFAVALGGGGGGARLTELGFDPRDVRPGRGDRTRVELAERVEQSPMTLRIEQPAVVVLAVDFHRERANVAQQPGRRRAAGDKGATPAIALQRPADDQRLARL